MLYRLSALLMLAGVCAGAESLDEAAVRIQRDLEARHLPNGIILDPIFDAPDSDRIVAYTRCGDAAIWTGHYVAAESFRYAVTKSAQAAERMRSGVEALARLIEIGGNGVLARCAVPVAWPFSANIRREEAHNNEHLVTYQGEPWVWIGRTSRDQYMGVLFGLNVAYEHTEDAQLRSRIAGAVTTLVDALLRNNWNVQPSGEDLSTTFAIRPEQQAAILAVARQVNPQRYGPFYEQWRAGLFGFGSGISVDLADPHSSYFKFNLDALSFYLLVRLEPHDSSRLSEFWSTYERFRRVTAEHGNAFFDLIDRALRGPDGRRDAQIAQMLADWLARPRRDFWVDRRGEVPQCADDRACSPIPVRGRVLSDFLWQRSPFQLYGGGSGRVENAGLDFLLPYWMARYYGVTSQLAVVSAAHGGFEVAAGSIASLYGSGLGATAAITVRDAAGVEREGRIFATTDGQINFQVPEGSAPGAAVVSAVRSEGSRQSTGVELKAVAPSIFTAPQTGQGPAAAVVWRNGTGVPAASCSFGRCFTEKVRDGEWVSFFATGVRGQRGEVRMVIHGRTVDVGYAGPQGQFAGLDQINVQIPRELRGTGETDAAVQVDGVWSNWVRLRIE